MIQTHVAFGFILLVSWVRSYSLLPSNNLNRDYNRQASSTPQYNRGYSTSTAIYLNKAQSNIVIDLEEFRENLAASGVDSVTNQGSSDKVVDIGDWAVNVVKNLARIVVSGSNAEMNSTKLSLPVASALQKMRKDMIFLDDVASRTPQLSTLELVVLITTVSLSALSPFILSVKVVEVLIPSLAALSASVGISAEYIGKVAVSNGKEFAALAIQAAAESEALLAAAERTKAVLPLCVGIATTASAFALLTPTLIKEIGESFSVQFVTEIYLICPLIAVLSAAIAGLATQESQGLASKAIGVGNRRFASSSSVGRTWMSATEQVESASQRTSQKWKWFALGVAPAPLIATLFPGPLSIKTIICAALAAAQAAYYLSIAEYSLAVAVDAVAFKARSAAVADTYANQGSRAGAILPFTSALAGLCAAASAAAVELLPLVSTVELQALLALLFPSGAALFAAAAAVSKARCEVDAAAAGAAAAMGLSGEDNPNSPIKDPIKQVQELIGITIKTSWSRIVMKFRLLRSKVKRNNGWVTFKKWLFNRFGSGPGNGIGNNSGSNGLIMNKL